MNMAALQDWLRINLLLAVLCLTGCATSLRPEIPRVSSPALNIAVADVDPLGMSKEEALTLTKNLRSALVQSERFQVVSRADMQKILKEQEFQRSDACNDTQCLVEMGKALAVQKIVGGSAGQAGGVYSLTLRVVDVETGKIEATVFKDIENVRDLLSSIRDLGRQLADMYGR